MSRAAIFFLLGFSQILALLLALLGLKTLSANPLGWILVLVGTGYVLGTGIVFLIRRQRFWESDTGGAVVTEEKGDKSFWFISLGMLAGFFSSPLEVLYLPAILPRNAGFMAVGLGLVILGMGLFVWARRTLKQNYSGHISVNSRQELIQTGPYRIIRHPAYSGYLLMTLGISLGYSSLAGLIATLVLLIPGLAYRMKVEEKLLLAYFGEEYCQYRNTTKRIIPGIW